MTHNIASRIWQWGRYGRPAVRVAGKSGAICSQCAGVNAGSLAMVSGSGNSDDISAVASPAADLEALAAYSLVSFVAGDGGQRIRLHPLVRDLPAHAGYQAGMGAADRTVAVLTVEMGR